MCDYLVHPSVFLPHSCSFVIYKWSPSPCSKGCEPPKPSHYHIVHFSKLRNTHRVLQNPLLSFWIHHTSEEQGILLQTGASPLDGIQILLHVSVVKNLWNEAVTVLLSPHIWSFFLWFWLGFVHFNRFQEGEWQMCTPTTTFPWTSLKTKKNKQSAQFMYKISSQMS